LVRKAQREEMGAPINCRKAQRTLEDIFDRTGAASLSELEIVLGSCLVRRTNFVWPVSHVEYVKKVPFQEIGLADFIREPLMKMFFFPGGAEFLLAHEALLPPV
jgi:hypothetical protein